MPSIRKFPDETLSSLIWRRARTAQLSVAEFSQFTLGLRYFQSRSDLDQLGLRVLNKQTLNTLGLSRSEATRTMIDPQWINSVFNPQTRSYDGGVKICPLCMEKCPYGQRFWRTKFAAACTIHGCMIVSSCAACGGPLPFIGKAAGIGLLHWLETWPYCPHCLRKAYNFAVPADRILVAMSRKWRLALSGLSPYPGVIPDQFLRASNRLIQDFTTQADFVAARALSCPNNVPSPIQASAALLTRLLSRSASRVITQAAFGTCIDSLQLAKDMVS